MRTHANPHLVLGSGSPRRVALMQQLDLPFEQLPSPEPEPALRDGPPEEQVVEAALTKALAVQRVLRDRSDHGQVTIVIGADTTVYLGNTFLGKPADENDAAAMLRTLSGRIHRVYTGLALVSSDHRQLRDFAMTRVCMRPLSGAEISAYIRTGEPLDKAGAYGIQGRGARFIEYIEGCYYNVVGMPLARLCKLLEEAGYDFFEGTGEVGKQ